MVRPAHAVPGTRLRLDPTLAALLVLAATLRVIGWGSVGLDHFDEGAYGFSAGSLAAGGLGAALYPRIELLAPPFQYAAGALVMVLFGISDHALIGLSVLLGVGTVGLVYVAAKRWLGARTALAAALLLAMSDFHVLYSRSGLADVSFGFWLLAALVCFAEAERRASWRWAVLAGLATGAAWCTKYHGWLALVIAAGAWALGARGMTRAQARASLARLSIAGLVAAAAYAPWALHVSSQPGGYALLLEHQATFVRPARLVQQAWAHLQAQLHLDGWLGRSAPGLAALLMVVPTPPALRRRRLARAGVVTAAGVLAGQAVFVGLAAVAGVLGLARAGAAGARLTVSFFLVFSALTPLYLPYPRLALPWTLAAVLLAGRAVQAFVRASDTSATEAEGAFSWPAWAAEARPAFAVVALAAVAAGATMRPPWRSASTYQPKDGFRTAAAAIAPRVEPGGTVLVWSEPAVAFYLRAHGVPAYPIVDIREAEGWSANGPLFLLTSLYATRIPGELGLAGWGEAHPGALTEVARAPVRAVSDTRILDDFGLAGGPAPGDLPAGWPGYDLRLYRLERP
ncbi:MAG TPA: glycosyltransferase family 39 protein [Candidatus Limnocylindrales bacterium]|nr:glycosyltransferase family 39 protein [Candidatus Limnocylindrales bacterium]